MPRCRFIGPFPQSQLYLVYAWSPMGAYSLSTALFHIFNHHHALHFPIWNARIGFQTPNFALLSSRAEHHYSFIFFLFPSIISISNILRPELLYGSMDGCRVFARTFHLFTWWYVFRNSLFLKTFLGLRECLPFLIFILVFLAFLETC